MRCNCHPSRPLRETDQSAELDDETDTQGQLKRIFGLQLATDGLLNRHDVTIQYVRPQSPGREARPYRGVGKVMRARDLREQFFQVGEGDDETDPTLPGLRLGDVVVAVDHQSVPADASARQWVTDRLVDAATENWAALGRTRTRGRRCV